ncbi:MAG TPA: c-type cytochrome [Chitinophagaceae bacterium]|nr:c-type cytochrome [Chitinophagaceae bacterium]
MNTTVNNRIFLYAAVPAIIACLAIVNTASTAKNRLQQENHAPAVKINKPKNDSSFAVNVPVGYNITVSDKEDGDSRYGERNSKEVLLQVKYTGNSRPAVMAGKVADAEGLSLIRHSNCFNCHAFNAKGIGPSFNDIVIKYKPATANTALVAKHIKEGSTGIWGNVTMPTHPELTGKQAEIIVDWILNQSVKEGIDYYIGASGTFRLKPPPGAAPNGFYMLTASYLDHGLKADSLKPHLEGSDVVFVKGIARKD